MLVLYPRLRDDDNKLIATIWLRAIEKIGKDADKMTGKDVLSMIANGLLPNQESIRRSRQKIQENEQWLRGKSYKRRKKEEKKVLEEIRKPYKE